MPISLRQRQPIDRLIVDKKNKRRAASGGQPDKITDNFSQELTKGFRCY